jgi:hypothetical protein
VSTRAQPAGDGLPDDGPAAGSLAGRPSAGTGAVLTVATYLAVAAAGVMLGLFGSFHLPNRPHVLGVHWPVAFVLAVGGNLLLGLLAGWGLRGRGGAAAAFLGWLVGVGVVMVGGNAGDVVIGGTRGDWVPAGFLLGGCGAGVVAVAASLRFVDPSARATVRSSAQSRSSLRAPGRR